MAKIDPTSVFDSIPHWHRLQTRATLFVMLLLTMAAGTSSLILTKLIRYNINQAISRDTIALADWISNQLTDSLANGETPIIHDNIQTLYNDQQIAFLLIQKSDNTPIDLMIRKPELWDRYTQNWPLEDSFAQANLSRPTSLQDPHAPEALVYRAPLFTPRSTTETTTHKSDRLYGYITVGKVDPIQRSTMQRIEASAALAVIAVSILSIPLTILIIRRLVRPLRKIARATTNLAAGSPPTPVALTRRDEIGVLARSFNEMARKLTAAHQAVLHANADLESQVDHRTKELQKVNQTLQREIETKNEFLRTVSHDLNAPLRNIAGMASMIQRRFADDLNDDVMKRLNRIQANVEIETTMLDDLLTLSRLRTQPGKPKIIDIGQLIEKVITSLSHELAEKEIECTMTDHWPIINVEPNLARQVFQNLIDNAIKYMDDAPPKRIDISHTTDEDSLRITIADTGPGIPEDELDHVFQVFRRGSCAQSGQAEGRGIGLPSVRLVAERWGGTIELVSQINQGCRFVVVIPIDRIVSNTNSESFQENSNSTTTGQAA